MKKWLLLTLFLVPFIVSGCSIKGMKEESLKVDIYKDKTNGEAVEFKKDKL